MSPEIDLQVIHVSQNTAVYTCVSVYKNLINFKNSNTDSPFANFLLGSFLLLLVCVWVFYYMSSLVYAHYIDFTRRKSIHAGRLSENQQTEANDKLIRLIQFRPTISNLGF